MPVKTEEMKIKPAKFICLTVLFLMTICSSCSKNSKETNVSKKPSRELFPIEVDGRFGYINKSGQIVIKPQFDRAQDFSDGLARKIGRAHVLTPVTATSRI